MRVLIVCRYKKQYASHIAPFVEEQVDALRAHGIEARIYLMHGNGIKTYFRLNEFRKVIKEFKPDLIHAHYGLCGLFANFQRQIPVVTTYHGSDININSSRYLSKVAMRLSKWNIFISQRLKNKADYSKNNCSIIPCGIDIGQYQYINKQQARKQLNLEAGKKYVLFASAFWIAVKNAPLAQKVVNSIANNAELIEMSGYSRNQVTLLYYAVDALLMTSFTEGSPQVIKEALASGCPIVSVNVGDVEERIYGVENCYIVPKQIERGTTQEEQLLRDNLENILANGKRTNGHDKVLADGLDNLQIAQKLIGIYKQVLACK